MSNDPQFVCFECAMKAEKYLPKMLDCTWYNDICEVCKKLKGITHVRNFGYPKFDTKSRQVESDMETCQIEPIIPKKMPKAFAIRAGKFASKLKKISGINEDLLGPSEK